MNKYAAHTHMHTHMQRAGVSQCIGFPLDLLVVPDLRTQASDVADWASVKDPEVRLLEPDGVVLERLSPQAVASGALHRTALAKSEQLAQEGKRKLEELGRRFPGASEFVSGFNDSICLPTIRAQLVLLASGVGNTELERTDNLTHERIEQWQFAGALHDQLGMCLPRDSVEKMKAAATELVGAGEDEMLEKLCRCISQSAAPPKPRHVVSLAKVIRTVGDAKTVLPLLEPCLKVLCSCWLVTAPFLLDNLDILGVEVLTKVMVPDGSRCLGFVA